LTLKLIFLLIKPSKILIVTHFWIPTKPKKMKVRKYEKIYQKNIWKKSKNNRSEKRMLECWKMIEIGDSKIQELKFWQYIFYWWESWDKENSIWERKVQNQMFMDSIKFYPRFNWIYGGFDCKKIDFLSQFRLLLKEIKVLGSNYNFEELVWSN
jgi:hypothetical protein